ncbi:MAG: DUF2178 domain-containing protein [Dehalococcoidales bacterium]|nr:DUF2178 domain-containing protein [Dehalococcoidales bacterium]
MDKQKLQRCRQVITVLVAILVGWSVATETIVIIPLIGIAAGMITLYLLKRRVKEVMADERSYLISEKAARTALAIFAPAVVVVAVVLIVLGNSILPDYREAGTVLAYSACALMVAYHIAHLYHEKKH